MPDRLSSATLDSLPPQIARPQYDRDAISPGIAHIGVGGFHRAHQAMYMDRLFSAGTDLDWGIIGIGLREEDRAMHEALSAQDGLYTLVLKHPDGHRERRVIGSLLDHLLYPDAPEAVLERLADPAIRIVSLTITEGGYNVSRTDGSFDLTDPAVASDLAGEGTPRSVFGVVTEALRRRRDRGIGPFIVMSCDNLEGNGEVARTAFTTFADARDEELGAWMREHVSFPSTMVDRITPVTPDHDREENTAAIEMIDAWPVVAEPFTQWVIQDDFPAGRPAWETVGAQLVEDVTPYELMKLRLLNSMHQAIAYFGHLLGHTYAHEAMQEPRLVELLRRYWRTEAIPTLPPVPGVDLDEYTATLEDRYGNSHVADTLARLCADSSNRIPPWLVPVVRENLASDGEVRHAAAIIASWARYAEGMDEDGNPIDVIDAQKERVMRTARSQLPASDQAPADADDLVFLRMRDLFGDLVDDPRFVAHYRRVLGVLHRRGASVALDDLLENWDPDQPGNGLADRTDLEI